jgi:hypothetical protein
MTLGRSPFIAAHEGKPTGNLFKMGKRFHSHNPLAQCPLNFNFVLSKMHVAMRE